ncbi:MAG: hypothetical protein Q7S51_09335 [Gallionellaceae bacterium]|nr:hypothetical protein [Gallionellaceae bacterium]
MMKKILNWATLSFMLLVSLTLSVTLLGGCGPGEDKTYTGVVTTVATGLNAPFGITANGGNLYVTNNGSHTVVNIVASGVVTIAGSGTSGFADGTGTLAGFNLPSGITTDGTYLYVTDTNNHAIRRILISSSAEVDTWAGASSPGADNGVRTAARFTAPVGLVWNNGSLYVADTGNHIIRLISGSGEVSTIAGVSGVSGFEDKSASAVAGTFAYFNSPSGITTDGISLYVADTGNHAIRKIDINATGVPVTTIAGATPLAPGSGFTDGTGPNARFKSPVGIVRSGANLYVADRDNHTIRKIDILTYVVTTLAGAPGSSGADDGTGTGARFNSPKGIAKDDINLYVTDTGNNRIRKIQ